ncbi:hypothetical protein T11_8243 [Trichinella zimbabwensis]|uniref:Uncharacterized protein n=1 Tax=Trichinella zimbabwensis TaxID=268475 RepID=A0A0V1GYV4_9BILA|nr:hypothetical protein T11_8243 [Trichinella zimbabwensis]
MVQLRRSTASSMLWDILSAYGRADSSSAIFNAGSSCVTNRRRSGKPCLCHPDNSVYQLFKILKELESPIGRSSRTFRLLLYMHGNRAVGAQKFHSSQFYWMSTMLYALQNSFSNIEAHRWLALNYILLSLKLCNCFAMRSAFSDLIIVNELYIFISPLSGTQ